MQLPESKTVFWGLDISSDTLDWLVDHPAVAYVLDDTAKLYPSFQLKKRPYIYICGASNPHAEKKLERMEGRDVKFTLERILLVPVRDTKVLIAVVNIDVKDCPNIVELIPWSACLHCVLATEADVRHGRDLEEVLCKIKNEEQEVIPYISASHAETLIRHAKRVTAFPDLLAKALEGLHGNGGGAPTSPGAVSGGTYRDRLANKTVKSYGVRHDMISYWDIGPLECVAIVSRHKQGDF